MSWSFAAYAEATAATVHRAERGDAELIEIWALGLGGEFLEMLASMEEIPMFLASMVHGHRMVESVSPGKDTWEEAGDVTWYLARLYVQTGSEERLKYTRYALAFPLRSWQADPMKLPELSRHVGRVVETVKKALRKEGRPGVEALTRDGREACGHASGGSVCMRRDRHEHESTTRLEDGVVVRGVVRFLPGRREEFGGMLDLALAALTYWFDRHGTTLEAVCEGNRRKLEARKAAHEIAERK